MAANAAKVRAGAGVGGVGNPTFVPVLSVHSFSGGIYLTAFIVGNYCAMVILQCFEAHREWFGKRNS